jgi:pyruvate dehydrogenase E2 component (dihydrolipoyllysine-residue acetyltransferase)
MAGVSELAEVKVPDIGDFTDVPVIEILVAPGEAVQVDQPLVTLESDKATMEIPSPLQGVVGELLVKLGDSVSEGTAILTIAPHPDEGAPAEAAAPGAVDSAVEAEEQAEPEPAAPPPTPVGDSQVGDAPERADANGGGPPYASPSVRRLARELGVDLSRVRGSGRKGRIVREDVEAAKSGGAAAPASVDGAGLGLAPWPVVDFEKFGPVERVPLTRIQRISGPNLARNWVMIPHVTQHDEADITDLEAFRKQLNAEQSDVKVTMVALLVKAVVTTLRAFPAFNSSLNGDELVVKGYHHIGFAADTPNGLVVPVIKDAGGKGILEIAAELTELSGKARAGKLMPGDMAGSTFTISSLGGIGGTAFTPIINAPEVAILGVSKSQTLPVWDGAQFVPRLLLPLSLSYDHRVIDGASAARFVVHLAGVLKDMRRALL